ncbi:hypothetical protein [Burkholderia territorii]|uniref:hypothetical protein n=1 Tax=Burkholderia territorii TaxID=1503055 RepID=UPI0007551393|nr:hypothetical protein [Burkholderia territorii]KUZ35271.1 hypothetical protein WS52_04735 [Burkholderia territorii]KUZ46438.1 hypothetical protein WS53_27405 [Burkholderia territorii]
MAIIAMSPLAGRSAAKSGVGDAKSLKCATAQLSLTAALALNDVLQGPALQKGSTIVDVMLVTSDLDTNGAPTITLDVGTGDEPQRFIAASTVGQAGGVARASAVTAQPKTLTQDDTVDVVVHAAPATGAATGTVTLHVFFLPPNA